ncbi:S-layer homology domain-containing protein [Sporosarcina highlanderae]|uniref:S-layer homology domain-containing protein n=1 Tax=Sporosarcina highlanderae TaxID=3035916 RepID=A0ABT8JLK1_9BACL|nr:S-layer homology domain-containing protein [Sporosarcina highlanderae]MDN4605955.1 S-layer homology domain-containing protein [Sporosarcina highlanderae]
MKRKLTAMIVILMLLIQIAPSVSHADELTGLTLEKEVREMVAMGIIKGFSDGKIYPKADVNRGDFAAFLSRTMKLSAEVPEFTDVNPSSAIAGEIGAIQKSGIMKGTLDGKFMPLKLMTREEMAVTAARAINYLGIHIDASEIVLTDESIFASAEGVNAAKIVFAAGIMNGTKVDPTRTIITFDPAGLSKRDQVAAVLSRFLAFRAKHELPELEPEEPSIPKPPTPPVAAPDKFQLAIVENKAMKLLDKKYDTYAEAVKAFTTSPIAEGIYRGKELLRIKSGMAFAQGPLNNATVIYSSPTFGTQLTYIEAGREMGVLEYAENYVKVQVGDTVGYVKHNQIDFVPVSISQSKDYYIGNSAGELLHYTYNYLTHAYGAYSIGPVPEFMKIGTRYYSRDGVHFLDGSGKVAGTHYPYFQFQSIRSKTEYTAEEIDAFILRIVAEKESTGLPKYAEATLKSKIIGLGSYIKEMEEHYRVNGLFILSAAMHESDFGMSKNAFEKNNLFGIRVFDSTPEAGEKYATPERSIEAFVLEYANKNYGIPGRPYAKGAVPGNKTVGFNVHYASDPTWGAKISGHMWRTDKAMGSKDFNRYRLARTNVKASLNVRTEPVVTPETVLFTFAERDLGRSGESGYPVAIVEQQKGEDGYIWYKIFADSVTHDKSGQHIEFGWIRGDFVTDLNTK